jgi:hypothetical protein
MKTLGTASKILSYPDEISSLYDTIDGVKSLGEFVNRVVSLSTKFVTDLDKQNTFKGDMLEVFTEIFFIIFSSDPALGLNNYKPVPLNEDYGVDAIGTNVVGNKCAVQIKFKSNPSDQVEYSDLGKTYISGRKLHGLSLEEDDTIFLFTTGNGATNACHHVCGNSLRVISKSIIDQKINGNQNFWQNASDLICDTLETLSIR